MKHYTCDICQRVAEVPRELHVCTLCTVKGEPSDRFQAVAHLWLEHQEGRRGQLSAVCHRGFLLTTLLVLPVATGSEAQGWRVGLRVGAAPPVELDYNANGVFQLVEQYDEPDLVQGGMRRALFPRPTARAVKVGHNVSFEFEPFGRPDPADGSHYLAHPFQSVLALGVAL